MSIIPTCGAYDYTYTIVGNPGVTFTSNGLQTLTSTSTVLNFSITGGSSVNLIKAKANYPNSISSAEASATLTAFMEIPSVNGGYTVDGNYYPIKIYSGSSSDYNQICEGHTANTNFSVSNATNVTWTRTFASPTNTSWWQFGNNIELYFWDLNQSARFQLNASNGCGSFIQTYAFRSKECSGGCNQYQVSPNLVTSNSISVTVPNIPPPCDDPPIEPTVLRSSQTGSFNSKLTISEIKVYNQAGLIKKIQKANAVKQVFLDLSGLTTGIYFIEITDGVYKETQQIMIQK
jgi:hypothetical protein